MAELVQIYVYLPDELVHVWAPVMAEPLFDNVYRIAEQPYDAELEPWEFVPGDLVLCRMKKGDDGEFLAATGLYSPDADHADSVNL